MNKIINGRTYTHQTQHNPPKYARIICEDAIDPNYPIFALILNEKGLEEEKTYTKYYLNSIYNYSEYDLTPINPYSDFKTDDLVAVKDSEKDCEDVRDLSHADVNGRLHCFIDGGTSFTIRETIFCYFSDKMTEEEAREILKSNEVME